MGVLVGVLHVGDRPVAPAPQVVQEARQVGLRRPPPSPVFHKTVVPDVLVVGRMVGVEPSRVDAGRVVKDTRVPVPVAPNIPRAVTQAFLVGGRTWPCGGVFSLVTGAARLFA